MMLTVAPFTGAWIEIIREGVHAPSFYVAPFTGAWIEIIECCHIHIHIH